MPRLLSQLGKIPSDSAGKRVRQCDHQMMSDIEAHWVLEPGASELFFLGRHVPCGRSETAHQCCALDEIGRAIKQAIGRI